MSFYFGYSDLWHRLPKRTNFHSDERDRYPSNRLDRRSQINADRLAMAGRMRSFVSRNWILQNVFNFSEGEINLLEQQMLDAR